MSRNALHVSQQLAYALPALGVSLLMGPMSIIQGIYAKYFGLPLTTIATVLLMSRLFDAVTDPVIGNLSDRYHLRTGSRKPFVVCGGAFLIISSYFLYVPISPNSHIESANVSAIYFCICFFAFYLSLTLFDIPHLAWGSELAGTSREKTKIYAWRAAVGFCGGLIFFAMPLLPFFDTNAFTPKTLQWMVFIAGLVMAIALFLNMKIVPDSLRKGCPEAPKTNIAINNNISKKQSKKNHRLTLLMVLENKPLLLFLLAFLLSGSGIGMWISLVFIFTDSYLGMGEHFALVSLIGLSMGAISLYIWHKLASILGNKITWIMSTTLVVIGVFSTDLLFDGQANFVSLLLVMILMHSGAAANGVLVPSLLSEVIDYSIWKYRCDYTASYFSIYTLIVKANFAFGGALGLAIVGWYGFDPMADYFSEEVIFSMRLSISWLPGAIILLSIIVIAKMTITTRRHGIILRRIDSLESRSFQY